MHKKRGFTLVELLVAMSVTLLLFATVGGTYIFMCESQGDLLDKSSELLDVQHIADYFKDNSSDIINKMPYSDDQLVINSSNYSEDKYIIWIDKNSGTLYNGTKAIFKNTNITYCKITKNNEDNFIRCTLSFKDSNNPYTFIIGTQTKTEDNP